MGNKVTHLLHSSKAKSEIQDFTHLTNNNSYYGTYNTTNNLISLTWTSTKDMKNGKTGNQYKGTVG